MARLKQQSSSDEGPSKADYDIANRHQLASHNVLVFLVQGRKNKSTLSFACVHRQQEKTYSSPQASGSG